MNEVRKIQIKYFETICPQPKKTPTCFSCKQTKETTYLKDLYKWALREASNICAGCLADRSKFYEKQEAKGKDIVGRINKGRGDRKIIKNESFKEKVKKTKEEILKVKPDVDPKLAEQLAENDTTIATHGYDWHKPVVEEIKKEIEKSQLPEEEDERVLFVDPPTKCSFDDNPLYYVVRECLEREPLVGLCETHQRDNKFCSKWVCTDKRSYVFYKVVSIPQTL